MFENKLDLLAIRQHVWRFIRYLWRAFTDDSCRTTAAALTYQTLFAVVPSLTVMYAVVEIMNLFDAFEDMTTQVESFVFDNLLPENVAAVENYLQDFSGQARNLGVPSLLLLGVTAFLMLFTIERTFNEIWKVKEPRNGSQRFLMYWAVLTLGPAFIIIGLGLNTYMNTLPLIKGVTYDFGLLRLVPLLLSASMFTLVYSIVPNCRVPIKDALLGGGLIAVVFEMAKYGFSSLMEQSSFQVIYGAFAAFPLFLLWIYVSWMIVLFGAEFVKSLGTYQFDGGHEIESPLFQIVFLLELFYRAHQRGEVVTDDDIRGHGNRVELEAWTDYKERLMALNLIRSVDKGGMILGRDLNEISVWYLYENLPWQLPEKIKGNRTWEKKLSSYFSGLHIGNKTALQGDLETLFSDRELNDREISDRENSLLTIEQIK